MAYPDNRFQQDVLVVLPTRSGATCGVRDYAVALAERLPIPTTFCYGSPQGFGSRAEGRPRLLPTKLCLPFIFRFIASRRPAVVLLHYTVFGYGRLPVQLRPLLIVALSWVLRRPVVTVWHETPSPPAGITGRLRRRVQEYIATRSKASFCCSGPGRQDLLAMAHGKPVLHSPIPSPFEGAIPTRPAPTTLRTLTEAELSPLQGCVIAFGLYGVGKSIDSGLLADLGQRCQDYGRPFVSVGEHWPDVPLMQRLGPLAPESLCELLSGAYLAVFPVREPLGPKSSSAALMLDQGVPILTSSHCSPCPACTEYGDAIACESDRDSTLQRLDDLLSRQEERAALRQRGHSYYQTSRQWQLVIDTILPHLVVHR